jgi:hypothetical protein
MFPEAKKVLGRERAMAIADEFQKAERQLVGATS